MRDTFRIREARGLEKPGLNTKKVFSMEQSVRFPVKEGQSIREYETKCSISREGLHFP